MSQLQGGFATPALEAAEAFRALMNAMARPGRIETLSGGQGPAPLSPAAAITLLTLGDASTSVHLAGAYDSAAIRDWLRFHTGIRLAPRAEADFALGTWADLMPLEGYKQGEPAYPDRSATLIVECETLANDGARLTGPGIETEARLSLPETAAFVANAAQFPLGLDFIFTAGDRVAALPRTTKVEAL